MIDECGYYIMLIINNHQGSSIMTKLLWIQMKIQFNYELFILMLMITGTWSVSPAKMVLNA